MTDTPEMVERVARAIHDNRCTDFDSKFDDTSDWLRECARRDARVAIAAMLTPTEAMKLAGEMARTKSDLAEDAYNAMISEALK